MNSIQQQKAKLIQEFLEKLRHQDESMRGDIRNQLWGLFLANDEQFSTHCHAAFKGAANNNVFKEEAEKFIKLEAKRPQHIPSKFYKTVLWHLHIAERNLAGLNSEFSANKMIAATERDKISYLSNLISDDLRLKDFYAESKEKEELLLHIHCLFRQLAEWRYDYKSSGKQDAAVAKKLAKNLKKCAGLLFNAPDIRFNLQMRWQGAIEKAGYVDLIGTLRILADYLEEIEPAAAKKSSYVKKVNAEDAVVIYAARRLKELFVEYRMPKRKHIVYITSIIHTVMGENVDEDRIRKLVV